MMTLEEKQDDPAPLLAETCREELIRGLVGLNDREFAQVFYAAGKEREGAGLKEWRGHLVLAEAETVGTAPWTVDYIGEPLKDEEAPASVICQSGRCSRCKATVRSWARSVGCPICGNAVYCP